jgi:hypothetical protein
VQGGEHPLASCVNLAPSIDGLVTGAFPNKKKIPPSIHLSILFFMSSFKLLLQLISPPIYNFTISTLTIWSIHTFINYSFQTSQIPNISQIHFSTYIYIYIYIYELHTPIKVHNICWSIQLAILPNNIAPHT